MKREDIREIINKYLENNKITMLSTKLANNIKELLKTNFPDNQYGNCYVIKSEYENLFVNKVVCGSIKRCDSFNKKSIIDTVRFEINSNMETMVWDNTIFPLTLDMDNLSKDDLIDIKNIKGVYSGIDVYKTFMMIKPEHRGQLAGMINNCLDVIGDDIPPYAFYNYEGEFYHTTNRAVGDIGGGVGFGGFIRESGTIAEIRAESIGEHAFDGCKNLTEVYLRNDIHYIGKHAFSNVKNLIIHCPTSQKPTTWDDEWCDSNCQVIWRT